MSFSNQQRGIGAFSSYQAVNEAVRALQNQGFPLNQVSVIGPEQNSTTRPEGAGLLNDTRVQTTHDGSHVDDGAKTGAATGGAIGGLTGLLVGLGALAIPGVGPIMLAGAAATAIATALAGGAIGAAAGGLLGGLVGLGIPENRAQLYSDLVAKGQYLILVDGTDEELRKAEPILRTCGIQEWDVYAMSNQPAMAR